MFLYSILVSFQIVLFLHVSPFQTEASTTAVTASTSVIPEASPTVNGSTSTVMVAMTTSFVINTSAVQPTPSSTAVIAPSSSVAAPSTSPPPAEGALQAVVISVAGMTVGEFEVKKSSFIATMETAVEVYCSKETCTETSRKRREVTVEKVYIASGYPKESSSAPGELVLAVFVSTGGNKFLSKHVLLTIVQEFRGNLSSALGGKEITGVGRLHLDVVKATDPPGSSGKTKILYIFFGVFLGIVLILAVCIVVTCCIGRKSDEETVVRPLTTSNLELVENQGGPQGGQR